jgi:hypothetical protein
MIPASEIRRAADFRLGDRGKGRYLAAKDLLAEQILIGQRSAAYRSESLNEGAIGRRGAEAAEYG